MRWWGVILSTYYLGWPFQWKGQGWNGSVGRFDFGLGFLSQLNPFFWELEVGPQSFFRVKKLLKMDLWDDMSWNSRRAVAMFSLDREEAKYIVLVIYSRICLRWFFVFCHGKNESRHWITIKSAFGEIFFELIETIFNKQIYLDVTGSE